MLNSILAFLQKIVLSEKSAIVGAAATAIISLVAGLGLHLNGSAVAVISALVSGALGYFLHLHIKAAIKAAAAASPRK